MKVDLNQRRRLLKIGTTALALPPLFAISQMSHAGTNAALRSSLKYQDTPQGEKQCGTCMQFVPGKKPKDKGGCKLMPGDTEISASGYCVAWAKKA